MTAPFTVLTVCTGNIHRSALAATLLQTWAGWYLPESVRGDVVVESAGTGAFDGEPMGRITRAVAASLGADGEAHAARRLDDAMVERSDLILTASRAHRDEILRRVPRVLRRTFTIREVGRIAALLPPGRPASRDDLAATVSALAERRADATTGGAGGDDIVDPHRKDVAVFDDMVREEVPALVQLAQALLGMPDVEAREYLMAAGDPAALRSPQIS